MKYTFVFGSNLAGRHGAGAALHAAKHYGAEYGVGEGLTGDAYALPTKDEKLKTRSLLKILASIIHFRNFAIKNQDRIFVLTPVGCGLAGHNAKDIALIVKNIDWPHNVVLHRSWLDHF